MLKRRTIDITASILNRVDGHPFSPLYRGYGHILMFHRVQPASREPRLFINSYLEVTPEYLQLTIDYFRSHGYAFLSLDEIPFHLRKAAGQRPFVAYTFDDGFKDNLEFGLPVFKRNAVPFSVHVTTGFPDHTAMLWWNELEKILLAHDTVELTIGGESRKFSVPDTSRKTEAFRAISKWLKYSRDRGSDAPGALERRIANILGAFGIDPRAEVRRVALSWNELRSLASEPLVTLGAHTVSHPVLAQLSEDDAFSEMANSKQRLSSELGIPIVHFAYPYGGPGEIGEREVAFAARAGFKMALTTLSSNVHSAHGGHLLALPRIAVGMSMSASTFDLIRHGVIPFVRNRGQRIVTVPRS